MSQPTQRDLEVSEACRNSGSRPERDAIVAAYRREVEATYQAKLEAVRRLVTYAKPLQGEQPGVPRFVVHGRDVLDVLEGA